MKRLALSHMQPGLSGHFDKSLACRKLLPIPFFLAISLFNCGPRSNNPAHIPRIVSSRRTHTPQPAEMRDESRSKGDVLSIFHAEFPACLFD